MWYWCMDFTCLQNIKQSAFAGWAFWYGVQTLKFIVSLALNKDEIVFEHFNVFDWAAIHGLRTTTRIFAANRVFIYWVSPRFTGECNPDKNAILLLCFILSWPSAHILGVKYVYFCCISGKNFLLFDRQSVSSSQTVISILGGFIFIKKRSENIWKLIYFVWDVSKTKFMPPAPVSCSTRCICDDGWFQ